jgi:hypothetical protein
MSDEQSRYDENPDEEANLADARRRGMPIVDASGDPLLAQNSQGVTMIPAKQTTGDKIVSDITQVTDVIGTLVPTVGAIGALVRLVAAAVRPTDAQKAQAFDAAIAEYDAAKGALDLSIDGFEAAKATAHAASGNHPPPLKSGPGDTGA